MKKRSYSAIKWHLLPIITRTFNNIHYFAFPFKHVQGVSWFRLGTVMHRRMPEMMVGPVKIHQTLLNGKNNVVALDFGSGVEGTGWKRTVLTFLRRDY